MVKGEGSCALHIIHTHMLHRCRNDRALERRTLEKRIPEKKEMAELKVLGHNYNEEPLILHTRLRDGNMQGTFKIKLFNEWHTFFSLP